MKHIHLIGIGGTGLSAIARVLLENGYTVSGSDRTLSPLAQNLQSLGVRVYTGHTGANITNADVVVRSSAVPDDNPEVMAARAAGIPVLKRAEFLGSLMKGKNGIAIAGTHGKTTTTAMIAWMLTRLEEDPSYIVGGTIQNLGTNAHAGKGSAFVIEADEYDRMFLGLNPNMIILTTLEHDHPDCYPTPEEYRQAFLDFTNRLVPGGTLLACIDNTGTAEVLRFAANRGQNVHSYGINPAADYQAQNLVPVAEAGYTFDAVFRRTSGSMKSLGQIALKVPGQHNALNALAALATADLMGLPVLKAARALGEFRGTGRRFEVIGETNGMVIIDDYAHHPTEIRATLSAARSRYPGRRIWAVWQPHTYTRTRTLLQQFASAFSDADQVIVTDIYAAREPQQNFSAAQVVKAMNHTGARFIPALSDVRDVLLTELRPGDVLLVLSAGDADQVSAQVLAVLQERSKPNV